MRQNFEFLNCVNCIGLKFKSNLLAFISEGFKYEEFKLGMTREKHSGATLNLETISTFNCRVGGGGGGEAISRWSVAGLSGRNVTSSQQPATTDSCVYFWP
jgi:hypothetical protein